MAARRPGGPPTLRPVFRVVVHHKYLPVWDELASRVGLANAQQFWDHVAMTPGQPPKVGTSSVMKGKHNAPKWPGYSRTIHYEITGAGRIDYQFNPAATDGSRGENEQAKAVVRIVAVDEDGQVHFTILPGSSAGGSQSR